jgi:Lectin C-type domain
MRAAVLAMLALAHTACLRATEFHCTTNAQCDPNGTCQPSGYCSIPDGTCLSGSRYTDVAGDQSNQCVGGDGQPGGDAGGDALPDGDGRCPSGYAALPNVQGDHRYLRITNARQWDAQRSSCATAANTYLAIPDDAQELAAITSLAAARVWLGITDEAMEGTFVTVRATPAIFLPWMDDAPGGDSRDDCVEGIPTTEINDERCNRDRPAVCECEP